MPALGRYELLRPLARGGMADVYLARRRVAGVEKRLVIKRLRRDKHRDPRFLEMFVREAQLSMSLVQQNIVPVFDFGRIGDDVFLAMEHIDGKDLGSTLARDRGSGMPPLLAAFVAAECCHALDHAHLRREQVIHRDVTPRNVLLSWAGEVKLADFGIAAVVGQVAGVFGTPGYMAPEQANGADCDARVDVYALGLVLWEALIAEHVRPSADRAVTLAAAKSGELPPVPDTIPEALATIVRRATALAPADRFASAREMADALDNFLVAERARDPGPAPGQRLAAWLKARWGDDWEDPSSAGVPNAADAIVTFLDDGPEEVRGAHTQRSIAETIGDETPAKEPEPPAPPAEPAGAKPAAETPAAKATHQAADAPAAAPDASSPSRAPRRWVLAAAGVAAAIAAVIAMWPLGAQTSTSPAVGSAPAPDAAAVAMLSPDASPAPDALLAPDAPPALPDASLAVVPVDAAVVDAAVRVVRTRPDAGRTVRAPTVDARPASTATLRPITIGAVPWAYFTVDDDPTQHETPKTLRLSVGAHRVTFSNPQLGISRTVTVTVPEDGDARHVERMR